MAIPADQGGSDCITNLEKQLDRLLVAKESGKFSPVQAQELERVRETLQKAYAGQPFSR